MKEKEIVKLFCDGSVNPQLKIGVGAYFILDDDSKSLDDIKESIQTKEFENTSSTKLELEVLLWALEYEDLSSKKIFIFTDCQNILSLKDRREKLEKNDYKTSTGKIVKNHLLYKKFYELIDKLDCSFEKVKGHKKSSQKNDIDKLFNLVDKTSRKVLRETIIKLNKIC